MRRLLRKRPVLGMALLSGSATAVGITIALSIDWFPTEASTASKKIDTLWDVLLIASVPVFVLVMSVALYSVFAFRVKPGDMRDGAPIHGNTKLEVVWVTIPFLMVTSLALYGWVVLGDIEAKTKHPLIVNVTAQQFAWSFEYPGLGKIKSNQLVLPKGRRVEFRLHTKDVIHSFWVPEFRLKSDTVPGLTTKVRVTPIRIGGYQVVCAELCGIGHSTMRQDVRVVSPTEFDSWVAKKRGSARGGGGVAAPGGGLAAAGKMLFNDTGCNACHTLADAGANGSIGPPLDDLAKMARKFGKKEGQSPEEYVKTSIEKPAAFVVPGFPKGTMPGNFKDQLSSGEIDTLVKYLLSVSKGKSK
jgi:cytochrome c oxidase subunit II